MTIPTNASPPARILMTTDTVGGVWTYSMDLCRALEGLVDAIEVSTQPNKRGHRVHVALRNARAALAPKD